MIPFAEWLPDQQDLNNPGATVAKNVVPHANGYKPLPSLQVYSDALSARPRGMFVARDADNTVYTYVGDETKLYSLADAAWTDVSRTASAYTTAATGYWEFAKWGENLLATNFANEIQKIALGGTNFADLDGGPPKARHIAVVRNFVVTGNTFDSVDGNVPNRVRWSAADDEESWTVSASTQADYEDLYGAGGWVQRVFGGEYGVVFQESSVWRMTYVGTPTIFTFDEVLPKHGLLAPGAACQFGDLIFFLSPVGLEVLTNGSTAQSIGANKIDRFLFDDLDSGNLDRLHCAVDTEKRHFYMAYPGVDNTDGRCNRIVIYDWTIGKWSFAEVESHLIGAAQTPGVTLDGLDSYFASLDDVTPSLDDPVWQGGAPQLIAFNSDFKLAFFSGDPMSAVIETRELNLSPNKRTLLNAVRPLIDGGSTSIQVATRNLQSASESWSATTSVSSTGRATLRRNARYHRVRANISGAWTHAQGVEVDGVPTGWR